ncbi:MAG: hypothetical protein Q4F17_03795 [Eubacteriales bacterium]|nr:hypothetical protein [Eubacteriales bacterium]
MQKIKKFDCYDGLCLCQGLVFYAPAALLVRTQAGLTLSQFFLLQGLLSAATFLGEVPTGILTDRIGYRRTLVLAQGAMLLARGLLLAAFLLRKPWLFVPEALLEGLCFCFSSGTADAYLYEAFGEAAYLPKTAHSANWGTAGFLASTLAYAGIYRFFGIPGLLVGTLCSSAAALVFALGLRPDERRSAHCPVPRLPEMVRLLGRGRHFVALGAVFSVAGLLINFFYVHKLLDCGVDAGWMSPLILGYSLVGMLAKWVLAALDRFPRGRMVGIFCALAAAAMGVLGFVNRILPAAAVMLVLPLLLDVPGCWAGALENAFVDRLGLGDSRAAALSTLSMGADLVEILALFASAALTAAGPELCFPAVGLMLLGCGAWFFLSPFGDSE